MRKVIIIAFLAALFGGKVNAQLKVGNNPTTINANSVLEVESTNKGLLLPRVALSATASFAPLTAHVAGMAVYNTATTGDVTPGYYYNDGTKWVRLQTAGAAAGNLTNGNGILVTNGAGATLLNTSLRLDSTAIARFITQSPVKDSLAVAVMLSPVRDSIAKLIKQSPVRDSVASVAAAVEPWYNVATNTGATANTQDIYQMGKVSVGTKDQYSRFTVLDSNLTDAFSYGSFQEFYLKPQASTAIIDASGTIVSTLPADNTNHTNMESVYNVVSHEGSGTVTNLNGSRTRALTRNSARVTNANGLVGLVEANSTSLVQNAVGIKAQVMNGNAANITTATGINASITPGFGTTGTIGTGYGIRIDSVTATQRWSLYASSPTAPSYFAGSVGIGVTNPAEKLDVLGNIQSSKPNYHYYSMNSGTHNLTLDVSEGNYLPSITGNNGLGLWAFGGAANIDIFGDSGTVISSSTNAKPILDVYSYWGTATRANITNDRGIQFSAVDVPGGTSPRFAASVTAGGFTTGTSSVAERYMGFNVVNANNRAMTIWGNAAGNEARIGIGTAKTAVPAATLELISKGSTSATKAFQMSNAGGTQMFTVWDNGNVGVGTTAAPASKLAVTGLPVYADNTAATAGGLQVGDFYRTATGVLMVRF